MRRITENTINELALKLGREHRDPVFTPTLVVVLLEGDQSAGRPGFGDKVTHVRHLLERLVRKGEFEIMDPKHVPDTKEKWYKSKTAPTNPTPPRPMRPRIFPGGTKRVTGLQALLMEKMQEQEQKEKGLPRPDNSPDSCINTSLKPAGTKVDHDLADAT